MQWQFWIDVGGTFTDCIGISPEGRWHQHKTLSSGRVPGRVGEGSTALRVMDESRRHDPPHFWNGSSLTVMAADGSPLATADVARFDSVSCCLELRHPGLSGIGRLKDGETSSFVAPVAEIVGLRYQLDPHIPAPVLAIRRILRLGADDPCPPMQVRFGTTRGTNALLTRTGARTILITTQGFADTPLIGNQARPDLFALNIRKPQPLFSQVLEVNERIAADGRILRPFSPTGPCTDAAETESNDHPALVCQDGATLRNVLADLRSQGFDSVAICLMNAYRNDVHERLIEQLAAEAGFEEISRSSEVSPLIRFVPRCDTTVLDAYLNPILRKYLNELRGRLPNSQLQVMTSSGGLVDSRRFRGRDSILSGPAGGIVGFSKVSSAEGFPRAIGFDMGGTSTDVSRFDGRFELQNETTKAGVRIMHPMLAIETIAAGGGSICGFDGIRLFVGPQSAGADPGPACYGSGGPLTVTDLNVFLGRIPTDDFPFRLDVGAIEQRLKALRKQMVEAQKAAIDLPLCRLAEGLVQIANDNMVRAIRRVSVARGYDPQEYVLVSFGGAGGLHACSLARSLRIRSVLLHPFAGILSAYGAGHADVRSQRQITVLKPLEPATLHASAATVNELRQQAFQEVADQGIPAGNVQHLPVRFELRYVGTDSGIDVDFPEHEADFAASLDESCVLSMRQAFEQQHRQQFGYVRADQMLEVVSILIEAIGRSNHPPTSSLVPESDPGHVPTSGTDNSSHESPTTHHARHTEKPEPSLHHGQSERSVWFNGEWHATPIYRRQQLTCGQVIAGPAIVCEPTSTIFIEPGCSALIKPSGSLLITVPQESASGIAGNEQAPDAVLLEIFSNQFASIAEQMGEMLRRTSVSTNVRERLDYSCALFDSDGQLVVNAPHVPVHLGAMGETVRAVMADHPDMKPGDVFVTNDPFRGGSHLPDVTVITPVFVTDSQSQQQSKELGPAPVDTHPKPAFYTANRAHHAEIGGIVPGSMPPFSRSLSEEGILIRSRRLVEAGRLLEQDLKQLLSFGKYPSRSVQHNLSDLAAQAAANACGTALLTQLVQQHSVSTVSRFMKQLQAASSQKLRRVLEQFPVRSFEFVDALDDGSVIRVKIDVEGSQATIDFSGSGDVHPGNLNANRAITTAAVLYTLRCLLQDEVPLNAGVLEPIRLVIPTGMLNPPCGAGPETTPAVVGGNVETSQRIVDVLFGALGLAAASQGTMNNLTFGNAAFGYYETICGGAGATSQQDGADAVHTHMTNTRLTDPEILEQRYPVLLRQFRIRRHSGGSGLHRGGDGIVRELQFLQPVTLSILSQRRICEPYGIAGGLPGKRGKNQLLLPGESLFQDIDGCFSGDVPAGTRLRIETPGGGGWGVCRNS